MLRKLFGVRKKDGTGSAAAVPEGSRLYVVGDIHGRIDLLQRIRECIIEDAAKAPPGRKVVIHLGDYVDRGESSRQVVDLLLDEPLEGFEAVFLSGNHEEMMLGFLDNAAVGAMWLHNGGDATLFSYGVRMGNSTSLDQRFIEMQRSLRDKVPERHLAFLRDLEPYHVEGDYLFVHAGIQPGTPIEQQVSQDLLWIRDEFLYSKADHGHCVVHGHTIVSQPEFLPNRIGIDTGAYFSNILTCLVLEGSNQRILQT
ncbi:MAG: serine/threonine protein phosphatase [Rhodospirillaceae bacterium]|nr:serine/threonine protein phosphatase [Rhodospirillaceae bacterium]MBT5048822.1 serine/threonine protein phosphatase [Rhodospirillaceae bacterium]MBT5455761.1 serine/threonine protein phosphatase [Rhodospirillaceae bacterium]